MLKTIRTRSDRRCVTLLLSGFGHQRMATRSGRDAPAPRAGEQSACQPDKRIQQERKEGEITKAQAAKLHREDRAIRKEERTMASTHHGHIHQGEQKALNQQGEPGQQSRSASNLP